VAAIDSRLVAGIRSASRELVRELGLMNRTVAGTDFSLSAVHAILEIGRAGDLSARELSDKLHLEKSTVSRLVKALVQRGQVRESRSRQDQRIKNLQLTQRGKLTMKAIDRFAEDQVSSALARLDHRSRLGVLQGLKDYSAAMKSSPAGSVGVDASEKTRIAAGYAPTVIGRVVEMLHGHMHRHYGFGAGFESRIASDLAEFIGRIESPANQVWRAERGGRIVGSVSIDGEDLGDGLAHLRWFVVDSDIRGGGVGELLLSQALEFCDRRGHRETHLWTVKGLDSARRLYLKHGFRLAEEYYGEQWGTRVLEHKFVRARGS